MKLDSIARKVIPGPIRSAMGRWSLNTVSRSSLLLGPYIRLVHGYSMKGLTVGAGANTYEYKGRKVRAPQDGTGSFFEVFYENVYDSDYNLKPGDVVLDIGAYVGMWSVKAAVNVGTTGKVFAMEPDATNRRWLQENVTGLPVTIVPCAVSNHDGKDRLYLAPTSSCHSLIIKQGQEVEIDCHTVDWITWKYRLGRVIYMKIDAEGAEYELLEHLISTGAISRVKRLLVEWHKRDEGPRRHEIEMALYRLQIPTEQWRW